MRVLPFAGWLVLVVGLIAFVISVLSKFSLPLVGAAPPLPTRTRRASLHLAAPRGAAQARVYVGRSPGRGGLGLFGAPHRSFWAGEVISDFGPVVVVHSWSAWRLFWQGYGVEIPGHLHHHLPEALRGKAVELVPAVSRWSYRFAALGADGGAKGALCNTAMPGEVVDGELVVSFEGGAWAVRVVAKRGLTLRGLGRELLTDYGVPYVAALGRDAARATARTNVNQTHRCARCGAAYNRRQMNRHVTAACVAEAE